jgi:hypothetical protein
LGEPIRSRPFFTRCWKLKAGERLTTPHQALANAPFAASAALAPATVAAVAAAFSPYMDAAYFFCEYYGKSGVNLTAADGGAPGPWDVQYWDRLDAAAQLTALTPVRVVRVERERARGVVLGPPGRGSPAHGAHPGACCAC